MEADVRRVRVLWPLDLDPAAAIDALGDPAALRGWRLRREGSVVWVVVCSADRHDDAHDADDQDHLEIVGEISSSRNSSRRLFEYRLDLGDGAGPRAVAREAAVRKRKRSRGHAARGRWRARADCRARSRQR